MYIKDGIAYAGEQITPLKISGVRPLDDYILWVRFNNGEEKTVDFKRLIDDEAFLPLREPSVWNGVYIDYGCTVWDNGGIDIAPEYLYKNGKTVGGAING